MELTEDELIQILYDELPIFKHCKNAARAIFKRLGEGVVWEDECEAYITQDLHSLALDFVYSGQLVTVYLPRRHPGIKSKLDSRQRVQVTVTRVEEKT